MAADAASEPPGPGADELRARLVRNVADVPLQRQRREPLYDTRCASVTNREHAHKLGAGYDELEPGMRSCPYHYHLAQEEMFVILQGDGTLRVAGQELALRTGDVVVIPPGPEYPHQIINTSTTVLRYLSISTQERPEICVYPDSGKVGAFHFGVRAMQRQGAELDYWDGEP
jgi:uncharacterized cupin superfamily protein